MQMHTRTQKREVHDTVGTRLRVCVHTCVYAHSARLACVYARARPYWRRALLETGSAPVSSALAGQGSRFGHRALLSETR